MALQTGQYLRGGANGGVTDADGRRFINPTGGIGATLKRTTSSAAPGAGVSLCALTSLAAGVYKVRGTIALTGTAETALTNVRLRADGAAITSGTGGGSLPTLSGLIVSFEADRVTATTSIDLLAIAAATAGSVYTVMLDATRVE